MKKSVILSLIVLFFCFTLSWAQQDSEYKDTPYFSGMPNYYVYDGEEIEFDSYNFYNGKDCVRVEGEKLTRTYSLKEGAKKASPLMITHNYANAVRSMGGVVIYEGIPEEAECANNNGVQMMVGRVIKNGQELWVEVVAQNGEDYYMTIILKEAMKQYVTAGEMLETLNRDGHVALYINFDSGKAKIKDDSRSVISQIVEMMKTSPELKIRVEGHTDNTGTPQMNKTLSEERAKAVVAAIVEQGIDPRRLSYVGYGQDRPVADNKTEEGRAKNRRVELVKQ